MTKVGTQLQALVACYFMHRRGYVPSTVVNVGVGASFEISIWHWLLPDAKLVGIDPRNRSPKWDTGDYIQAAASDGSRETLDYCTHCKSLKCEQMGAPRHNRLTVKAVTIDEVTAKYKPPFLIWLDCDGGEIDALKGATHTIRQTAWLSIEMRDFGWNTNYKADLLAALKSKGFALKWSNPEFEDCLFYRRITRQDRWAS